MSLETLLEAAKYLEHKNDDKKTSPSKQKVMKLTGPSSEIVSEVSASHVAASHHATSNPGARGQSAGMNYFLLLMLCFILQKGFSCHVHRFFRYHKYYLA